MQYDYELDTYRWEIDKYLFCITVFKINNAIQTKVILTENSPPYAPIKKKNKLSVLEQTLEAIGCSTVKDAKDYCVKFYEEFMDTKEWPLLDTYRRLNQ